MFISHQTDEKKVAMNSKAILCGNDGSASVLHFDRTQDNLNWCYENQQWNKPDLQPRYLHSYLTKHLLSKRDQRNASVVWWSSPTTEIQAKLDIKLEVKIC